MRPVYDPETGVSQAYQALYTNRTRGNGNSPKRFRSSGRWSGRRPRTTTSRWTSSGSEQQPRRWPGSVVAASPKDLFCMTSDVFVGGVPNTPAENEYPGGACTDPEGRLGPHRRLGRSVRRHRRRRGHRHHGRPQRHLLAARRGRPLPLLAGVRHANNITDTKMQNRRRNGQSDRTAHAELDTADGDPRKPRPPNPMPPGRSPCPRPPAAPRRSPRFSSCSTGSRSALP